MFCLINAGHFWCMTVENPHVFAVAVDLLNHSGNGVS